MSYKNNYSGDITFQRAVEITNILLKERISYPVDPKFPIYTSLDKYENCIKVPSDILINDVYNMLNAHINAKNLRYNSFEEKYDIIKTIMQEICDYFNGYIKPNIIYYHFTPKKFMHIINDHLDYISQSKIAKY